MTIINNIEIDNVKYTENDIKKAILNNLPIENKLHVVIVLSNPGNYAIRYILTKEFIRRIKDEDNVILYVVELAYNNQDYHITEIDNDKHLRLRSFDNYIWHKENLINIAINKLLPENWKAVAWVDADIEFDSASWAMDTLKILNGCKDIVQLFSHNVFMDAKGDTDLLLTGLGFQYIKKTSRSNRIKDINSYWHPGFAWACTRKFYEKMNGLYEYAITGDGDMQMASCFLSNYAAALPSNASIEYKKTLKEFEDRVSGCRIGYVPGIIRHHYHGTINSRKYDLREYILTKYDYSPVSYLTKNKDGLLVSTDKFPNELKESILTHFRSKNEDSTLLPVSSLYSETKSINIVKLIEYHFNTTLNTNCILINIKKDIDRFQSSKEELKKIGINNFVQFDATYWKDSYILEKDLNTVIDFLKRFNNSITTTSIKINEFSETNIPDIKIQAGPLACFCSHVKSMIYAYHNFSNYTIIVEDVISIDNIDNIQKYIQCIPNDWDIICFNSKSISTIEENYYKFHSSFYHLHFYIIKNTCLPTIFENLYPITDQIDIMIGNLHDKLNIYNINNTVTQKNFITNIQNNLHIVYNTPVYSTLRNEITILEELLIKYIDNCFNNDYIYNIKIAQKIIEDVIYSNIFNNIPNIILGTSNNNDINDLFIQIQKIVSYFVKDINTSKLTSYIYNEIKFIIDSFTLNNETVSNLNFNDIMKAYDFGSTASVYILGSNDLIVKVYNTKLRWKSNNHDILYDIFKRELEILQKLNLVHSYDEDSLLIKMYYKGESLLNNFKLPMDYKEQIKGIFENLNTCNIYYPEFNLNNILILKDKISFIDYGLANINKEFQSDCNKDNCKIFIELLEILENRFNLIEDTKQIHILYNTFMNNMRNNKRYIKNIF